MKYEQLSVFSEQDIELEEKKKERKKTSEISQRIIDEFGFAQIPFWGCNYELVYPILKDVVPKEEIMFNTLDLEQIIACEMICAAICHQMNWDYLRSAVNKQIQKDSLWVYAEHLRFISEKTVESLFEHYPKRERVRALERTSMLRKLGDLAFSSGGFTCLFFGPEKKPLAMDTVSKVLLDCDVFGQDPGHKKFHLLMQKLSSYSQLSHLATYCEPAVDYHLLRCFLRRGLLFPKSKFASEYILATEIERKESTVGALRHLCANLMMDICQYTALDINSINVIEWQVARSICTQEKPDCLLESSSSTWARKGFERCPFFETCNAANHNKAYLELQEPKYTGTSY